MNGPRALLPRRRLSATLRVAALTLLTASAGLTLGCAVGEGEGAIQSDKLYMQDCWDGKFDLHPDFFAANPFQSTSLMIRIQRGDNIAEQSDGALVLVNDLQTLRKQLSESSSGDLTLKLGLPPGVSPPGVPLVANPDPAKVSIAIYLHNTCHVQNATVYSLSGQIVFRSLFSGNLQEGNADARLTDASFDGTFADPRQIGSDASANAQVQSHVTGSFRFYFQRGQPAQPFQ